MRITVVGAGHGGTTIGADLQEKGHSVTLLKTSKGLHNEHFDFLMKTGGAITIHNGSEETSVQLERVTADMESAIKDAELIILYVQTNYHEQVINSTFAPI